LKKVDGNLRKIDENQTQIIEILMKMTHQGKDPEMYGNKEVGGSHGEVGYNLKKVPGLKEAMEGVRHMDRWGEGLTLVCTCPHS
jgi:hypothetical protein